MSVSIFQVQQGSPSSVSSNTEHSSCSLKPPSLHVLHKATQVLDTLFQLVVCLV